MHTLLLVGRLVLGANLAASSGPSASLAARPTWETGPGFTRYARSVSGYAPTLGDAATLFEQMPAEPSKVGALEGALVVCRITTTNTTADTFSAPDLHVRLRLGPTPEVADDGPEDTPLAYLSAPLVDLKPGQQMRFEVWDRDVTTIEFIGAGKASYAGEVPFRLRGPEVEAECRAWGRTELEAELPDRLARADAALAALGKAVDGRAPDSERLPGWGFDGAASEAVDGALRALAGLVGWGEPRVAERVAARERAHARWAERVRQAMADLERQSGPLAAPQPLGEHTQLAHLSGGCGEAAQPVARAWARRLRAGACALEVELRDDQALVLERDFGELSAEAAGQPPRLRALPSVMVLDARGVAHRLAPLDARAPAPVRSRTQLAAGQPLRVLYTTPAEAPPPGEAPLVALEGGGPALVLRLAGRPGLPATPPVPSP